MTTHRAVRTISGLVALAGLVASSACGDAGDDAASSVGAEALTSAEVEALRPADVSVLLPAPDGANRSSYLRLATSGRGGALVPASVIAQLPATLDVSAPGTDGAHYGDLLLVGVRLDPCAAVAGVGLTQDCHAEVRLVFQGGSTARMHDGAVHAFYAVDRASLRGLVSALAEAKRGATSGYDGPLGVHPLVERQGMEGAFARALLAEIVTRCGAANLSRVTFFARTKVRPKEWEFGAFSVSGGGATPAPIATLQSSTQRLALGRSIPASPHPDNPLVVSPFDGGVGRALRVENPRFHTAETIACVECHQTHRALTLIPAADANEFTWPERRDVVGNRDDDDNLHFFSYDERARPSVSRRTGNESAVALARLRTLLATR
jgi:hypothetical protein